MSKMISLTDDGHMLASAPIGAVELTNIFMSAQMQAFQNLVNDAPQHQQLHVKEELYDIFNQAASAFLEAFAPEIELRPDLTAEAILQAENAILDNIEKSTNVTEVTSEE